MKNIFYKTFQIRYHVGSSIIVLCLHLINDVEEMNLCEIRDVNEILN